MRVMRKVIILLAVGGLFGFSRPAARASQKKKPLIQMAILLDTSSSMDGLIAQAKSQLWKVVNEFIRSKRDGRRPEIQVALYEYGKSSIPAGEGYLRMIMPLTTDLDKVSEELFALRTNGGQEYCGQVIQAATRSLAWSKSNRDLKVIFIAGNEPFTQGRVDYRKAVREAVSHGIIVNTIHCGSRRDGINGKWKDGAMLADGNYMNIDQNRQAVHIAAPQDAEIDRLGRELNKTYVGYGRRGSRAKKRQAAQDTNAAGAAAGSLTQRSVYKASPNYSNSDWDLVDAEKKGKVKLDKMKAEDLPAEMREMKPGERSAYLEKQSKKRAEIQAKIRKLAAERRKYVADKKKQMAKSGTETLDGAMIKSVRQQASKKHFEFE